MGKKRQSGFTLIELMVTVTMFVVFSSMFLFSYPRFSENYRLDRAASEIAGVFSEAQSRALGIASSGSGQFPGFGVYFNLSTPREYVLFSDNNADGFYNSGEEVKRVSLESPLPLITSLCHNTETNPPGTCVSSGSARLDIVYLFKIGPEPVITLFFNGSVIPNYSDAEIVVRGPLGTGRGIIPWVTGYTEIKRCPDASSC